MGHDSLRMNSTKSMIGHLLGGAGAVEAVATIKAIETGAGWLHFWGGCSLHVDMPATTTVALPTKRAPALQKRVFTRRSFCRVTTMTGVGVSWLLIPYTL
jgi:3-oxoacyl-(acyl-carrier-protein) synthase